MFDSLARFMITATDGVVSMANRVVASASAPRQWIKTTLGLGCLVLVGGLLVWDNLDQGPHPSSCAPLADWACDKASNAEHSAALKSAAERSLAGQTAQQALERALRDGPDFNLKSGGGGGGDPRILPAGDNPSGPAPQSPPPVAAAPTQLATLAAQQISRLSVFVAWRDELPWGRQTSIKAVIASADRAEAKAGLADASGKTHAEEETVPIGRKVRAELSGPNVEITKPEQTVRDVTTLENVTFEWLVKPTRPGRTTLTLRVFNQLITPDGPVELERPALVHEMSVKIGLLDWLTWHMDQMKGLQWVIGGLAAFLGVAFANRAKLRRWWRRRHPPAPPASPPAPPPHP
jgi:hypothetical protein